MNLIFQNVAAPLGSAVTQGVLGAIGILGPQAGRWLYGNLLETRHGLQGAVLAMLHSRKFISLT